MQVKVPEPLKTCNNRALTCGDAGGCPFVSHDISALKASLLRQEMHKDNIDLILKLCHHKMYGYACQSFMQHKLKQLGEIQSDFISDERHIKIEVDNSPSKHVTSDSNIRTCQEEVQHNGINRTKVRCTTRSSSQIHQKMLPDELADDIVVKFPKSHGTSLSLVKNLVDSNLNLQNETTLLNLPLSPTHNLSICSHWVSSLNGEFSVNNQRKHFVYRRKRYLFKMTSKNQVEELVQKEKCSNTSSCDRNIHLKKSSYIQLDNDKLTKQKLNSDTEAFQDRFSHCSKQAEPTSLVIRKLNSFSSDVCEDVNVQVYEGIYVPAVVAAARELVDPGEWLLDHVERKQLADPSERKKLPDSVNCKFLPNPAKRKLLSDHDIKQLSDHSEENRLSGPECTLLSDPVKCKRLSYHVEGKQLTDFAESKHLPDFFEGIQLSNPNENTWLVDAPNCKLFSNSVGGKQLPNSGDGKWLLNSAIGKQLSISAEAKWLPNSAEGKWLSNSAEDKWLSNSAVGKQLSISAEAKWLPNSAEGKRLSNSAVDKWLLNSAEGTWLSEPGRAKQLVNPGEVGHLFPINTQQPEYQRCQSFYNGFSTLLNTQLPSDPLFKSNLAGSVEMKTDSKFLCDQNYHGELACESKKITEKETRNLNLHSLAESAVAIKKPSDVYWFSRDLLQL